MKQFTNQNMLVKILCFCLVLQLCMSAFVRPVIGADGINNNLVTNSSFEEVNDNIPSGWQGINNWGTSQTTLTQETAHSGNYSVVIEPNSSTGAPWVAQMMEITGGATYELSAWIKSNNIAGSGAYIKIEYYSEMKESAETYVSMYASPFIGKANVTGDWQNISYQVKAPIEAKAAKVYIRVVGFGKVYWDDISFRFAKQPEMISISTDEIFYYPELTLGKAKVGIRPLDGILENKFVDIHFFNKLTGEILKENFNIPAQNEIIFEFDPGKMSMQDEYTIEVSLKASSEVLETQKKRLFRWERPLALNDDLEYIIDGKPFFPVIMYHVSTSQYPLMKEIGVNTVQGLGTISESEIKDFLDKAQENGLKVVVPLYAGMKVKENFEYTHNTVTKFKDHPAVLAWAVMDEPSQKGEEIIDELVEAYHIIRLIDPMHPVYMVECAPSFFETVGNTTDILLTDSYPLSKPTSTISTVGEYVANAKANVGDKPIWTILQTFRIPPGWPYLPNIDEVRNMAYQAIIEGAQGLGYYSLNDPGWNLSQSELWEGLKVFKEELDLMGNLVFSHERVAASKSDTAQWAIWKNGQDYYAAVLNLTREQQNVTLPLDINGYKAELLYGEQADYFGSLKGELSVQLKGHQALMYKITPFLTYAELAENTLIEDEDIIEHQHWNAQVNMIAEKLHVVKAELTSESSNMKKVIDDTANVLRDLEHLKDWVYKQSNLEEKREFIINTLTQVEELIGNITNSLVQMDVEISNTKLVLGELVQINVKLQNNGRQDITNAYLALNFPEEFGMQNDIKPIFKIKHGEIIEEEFSFNVPEGTPVGEYSLNMDFNFEHHTVPLTSSHIENLNVANIVDANISPVIIPTRAGSNNGFSLNLVNNASDPIDVTFDFEIPEGISLFILKQVTLAPDEVRDIEGILQVSDTVLNGSYEVQIIAKVNDDIVSCLPIRVMVDNNLIFNSGFEEDLNKDNIPDGWGIRKGIWVQGVGRNGSYAVSLIPDSQNLWNVINTAPDKKIEAVPGKSLKLKVWAKNASTTSGVYVGIRESNSGSITVKYHWVEVQKNSDWTEYGLTFTPSDNTKYIEVYLKSEISADGQSWFDDVRIDLLDIN